MLSYAVQQASVMLFVCRVLLDLHFPLCVFKKLLNRTLGIEELQEACIVLCVRRELASTRVSSYHSHPSGGSRACKLHADCFEVRG